MKLKTKRLLFVSSLYSKLDKNNHSSKTWQNLNAKCKIANNCEALEFPVRFGRWFLKKSSTTKEEILQHQQQNTLNQLVDKIIDNTPRWLKYHRPDMENDIKNIFNLVLA